MLSDELKARVRAALERSRDRELNFQRVLPVMRCGCARGAKARIRVKATSYRWSLPVISDTGSGSE